MEDKAMTYDYGPNVDFNINTTGAMLAHNGSYSKMTPQNRYLLQALCHMIYQIKDDIQASPNGILKLGGVWLHWLHTQGRDDYSLYTDDMMTAFHIIETGCHSYDVEFISPNQLQKADPLLDYAYQHRLDHGRTQ